MPFSSSTPSSLLFSATIPDNASLSSQWRRYGSKCDRIISGWTDGYTLRLFQRLCSRTITILQPASFIIARHHFSAIPRRSQEGLCLSDDRLLFNLRIHMIRRSFTTTLKREPGSENCAAADDEDDDEGMVTPVTGICCAESPAAGENDAA
jgi:hypothetical protein